MQRYNASQPADLYFWRDNIGHEVDLLFEVGQKLQAVEIKSGATFVTNWLDAVGKWQRFADTSALSPQIVYGGDESYTRKGIRIMAWRELATL